ncbi:carbon starvation protein A, partial [Veillonellaceae bacterium M2-8]|nr:carbon starvation protein A [Veillonellaceae bacterium M2-8]
MITFLIGIVILVVGGILYGKYVESVFGPDDRPTPATKINDGVDYVPMKKNKNALIELLNIAGTGPILGPIQGILFGPIAFLLIPIGCV